MLQIFESRKNCEVDPSKLSDNDNLESNLVSCCDLDNLSDGNLLYRLHYCSMSIEYLVPSHLQVCLVLGRCVVYLALLNKPQ